jgi:NAD(P)-dependent dehydrogenase (short-subunit alcohol dehydrogenase family)
MADQQKYTSKLHGAKVLVMGGTSGIGFGVAEACLENGATVIISSSNEKRIQDAVARLQTSYPSRKADVTGYPCNLKSQELESNIVKLLDSCGTLDHIVYTAGDALKILPLSEITLEAVQEAGLESLFKPVRLGC